MKGFVHVRNRLYDHLKASYPGVFSSRDDIGECINHQEVNQKFQYQLKPKVVTSMIPRRPFHSLSLDLIDKSNKSIFNNHLNHLRDSDIESKNQRT